MRLTPQTTKQLLELLADLAWAARAALGREAGGPPAATAVDIEGAAVVDGRCVYPVCACMCMYVQVFKTYYGKQYHMYVYAFVRLYVYVYF